MKAFLQISVPHRIVLAAFLLASALPFAAHAAEVEGHIYLGTGSTYDLAASQYADPSYDFYSGTYPDSGLGFKEGSIVQIVAVTGTGYDDVAASARDGTLSSWVGDAELSGTYDYSTLDGDTYFAGASGADSILQPDSVKDGQMIVATTTLEKLDFVDGQGNPSSLLTAYFHFDYTSLIHHSYVGFYVRVFSATSFPEGDVVSNVVWGASALYTFQGGDGGEWAEFSGMSIVGTNNFEVIPEPATTSLFLFGAAALLARRRRNPFRGGRAMKSKHLLLPVLLCTVLSVSGAARANVIEPVYLMPDAPVTDALGNPFPGTCNEGDGGLVEIREVGSGIVPPDALTGKSDDAANPLLLTGHFGDNTLGRDSGLFTLAIQTAETMPVADVEYFARVFDAPDSADAVLYSDSEPFFLLANSSRVASVSPTTRLVFNASVPVDPEIDPYAIGEAGYPEREVAYLRSHDSDGDGWSDWFERTHGMDAYTPYGISIAIEPVEEPDLAYAGVSSIAELTDEELDEIPWRPIGTGISWTAVSGMTYVVDFASDLADPDGWVAILTNVAESSDGFVDVSEFLSGTARSIGFFRVKGVPQPGEGPARTGNE